MNDTIINQGAGYTIALTDEAETGVPYGPVAHGTSAQNHGFVDLRNRPDLIATVPEARDSIGMQALLQAVNATGFRFMSLGCERLHLLNDRPPTQTHAHQWSAYIQVAYRESALNRDTARFIALAQAILSRIEPSNEHVICFEMIIEPLRHFFGEDGCYALTIKPFGFGISEELAVNAFEFAVGHVAAAFADLQRTPGPESVNI